MDQATASSTNAIGHRRSCFSQVGAELPAIADRIITAETSRAKPATVHSNMVGGCSCWSSGRKPVSLSR